MNKDLLKDKLENIDKLNIKFNIPIKEYTTFKVGGSADIFLIPLTIDALQETLKTVANATLPVFILGRGSNIIVGDRGFRGIIIYMGELNKIEIERQKIIAEAGISLATLARRAHQARLTGLEFASGIPGTLGGALFMNAGAYGGEIKDTVQSVLLFSSTGKKIIYSREELKFSYRHSILQKENLIAARAILQLQPGNKDKIGSLIKELNQKRRAKQPLEWPSAGSIFKRPEGHYTGPLIEGAGLKGLRVGDAQVSDKHAGFIINLGNATARDIQELIKKVQEKVYQNSGVKLEVEPRFIGDF